MPALATDMSNAGYAEAREEVEETETVTEVQESVLPAQDEVAGDDADNGAGEAENIVTEASSSTVGQRGKAEKRYKCTVCEKSYARKQYLREHQKAHLFGPEWKCGSCDKTFTHKCILKQHEQQMHASEEDRILCPQCGKQFRSKPNLKQHMVVHEKKEENYSKEMKQEALQLIKKHGKAEGARRLKVSYSAIKRWELQSRKCCICSICGKELSEYSKLKQHEMKFHGKSTTGPLLSLQVLFFTSTFTALCRQRRGRRVTTPRPRCPAPPSPWPVPRPRRRTQTTNHPWVVTWAATTPSTRGRRRPRRPPCPPWPLT